MPDQDPVVEDEEDENERIDKEIEECMQELREGLDAEGGEEEEQEHDDVVEAVIDHEQSNDYDDVEDDCDDDVITPVADSKKMPANANPKSAKAPRKKAAPSKAAELAPRQPDDEAVNVASDEEGDATSKGTHKDPIILLMSLFVFVLHNGLDSASMHVFLPGFCIILQP